MPAFPPLGRIMPGVRLVPVLLLWLGSFADATEAAAPPTVQANNRQEIVFSLELPAPTWRPAPSADPAAPAWDAVVPGYNVSGQPGKVRVPRAGGWLVVPPGTVPRLEVIAENWQPLDGRQLAREPVPVMQPDLESGGGFEQAVLLRPGEPLPSEGVPAAVKEDWQRPDPALTAGAGVRLGEPVWWRGRRIVSYTVLPIRVEQDGLAGASLRRGEWRVRFVTAAEAGKNAPPAALRRLAGKGDDQFAGYFLNGTILAGLSTEAVHQGVSPAKLQRPFARGTSLGYPEIRIPVRRTQLHRVRASEMQALGLLPQVPLQASQLRLYQRRYLPQLDDPAGGMDPPYLEIEVPIHVVSEGESFGGDDLFLFWGLRPRDDTAFDYPLEGTVYAIPAINDPLEIYNENNVYWLQLADPDPDTPWARMAQRPPLPSAQGGAEVSYRRTDFYNEALAYREHLPHIDQERYYYNTPIDPEVRVNLSFWAPVPGQTAAQIQMGIANYSSVARTMDLDLLQGETQVATLPSAPLTSRLVQPFGAPLPPAVMGGSALTLRMRNSSPNLNLLSFLDWVQVSYDAQYVAPAGRLLFPGGDNVAIGNLIIPGFDTDDIGLIEVTDPRNPAWISLTRSNLIAEGDLYSLSLQVDQGAGLRRFYAAARMTSNGVVDIRYSDASLAQSPVIPTQLQADRADVLVVVHPEFMAQAQAWIEYRRSRVHAGDLTFQVVQPQDLFDWYSGGLKDPWAIKRLVNHGLDHPAWGSWALVLVGTANENPREIGVLSSARQWSRDWVPTHFHVQDAGSSLAPEVLGSDKWYVSQAAGDTGFPGSMNQPTDLYVGRFPVNTPAEMARVLTKIQQVESVAPGQDWRRRSFFIADDAWSSGTLGAGGFTLRFWSSETAFEDSEVNVLAQHWVNNGGMVDLAAEPVLLRPYMEPIYPEAGGEVSLAFARDWCEEIGAPDALIAALSRGGTLAHFQGHANHWLLTHEIWLQHQPGRRTDIDRLTNHGKPWVFFGMGCHIGDYSQNVGRTSAEPGIGEKMLLWTDAGAVAVYASTGYEYLQPNRRLSQDSLDRMMNRPPHVTVSGQTVTSRWRLGELMWASEADVLAAESSVLYRGMVYQYHILGDPLLRLDAGLPEVDAVLEGPDGGPIQDFQAELVALDASGLRTVTLQARDEAGIDRLQVLSSTGGEVSGATITATPYYASGSRQIIDYELVLPVRPFAHDVLVRIYDSGALLDGDPHVLLTLNVAHDIAVVTAADGEPLDPFSFVFVPEEPVALELTVTSAAWFDDQTAVTVRGANLDLAGITTTVLGDHTLHIALEATAPAVKAQVERGLELEIDGHTSYVPLVTSEISTPAAGISRLVNFPNPMREATRFVFATDAQSGRGNVRVWTVSGRQVASVPFTLEGSGQEVVTWNGRDREGDRLANGTYLYRVEIDGAGGQIRSGMQRLVVMR